MDAFLDYKGYCPICDKEVRFLSKESWYRDHLFCCSCFSIPRFRAFFYVLKKLFPNYRYLKIHESSPLDTMSKRMFGDCSFYTASHYFPDIPLGEKKDGYRCEDLERLTFKDNTFDLFITMDVMEHVLDPDIAFKNIQRVLKPGGAHIFTLPIYDRPETVVRAYRDKTGEIHHLLPDEYHGNPIADGSLVIREWGKDVSEYIYEATGMPTKIYNCQNERMGILGEMTEVLVSQKVKETNNIVEMINKRFLKRRVFKLRDLL